MKGVNMIKVGKYNIRIVKNGDKYGLDNKLTYDENKPMVEFYDSRYPHSEFGQFISRYYIGTILCLDGYYGSPLDNGLCLDGGNPNEWSVSSCEMQVVKDYVSQHI
jgi:hypothetical protein